MLIFRDKVIPMGAKITAGYSGTPLAKKLGIKPGLKVKLVHIPQEYRSYFNYYPRNIYEIENNIEPVNFIHYFANEASVLRQEVADIKKTINTRWDDLDLLA